MASPSAMFGEATSEAPPRAFVIAELGVNHDGDPGLARKLVDAAADAGADAVKLQRFHPDRLLSNQARLAAYQRGKAEDAYRLLARLALDLDAMAQVGEAARRHGLRFLVTPFSLQDAEDLKALNVDAVKIASPDAVNRPLLIAAAKLGKPLVISTGTCELHELEYAAELLRHHIARGVGGALLHCVSSYPTPREHAALGAIRAMRQALDVPVGYSDHTPDVDTGALAAAAGAVVLEKHLTHDKSAPGPDHAASVTTEELADYVRRVREVERMIGPAAKRVLAIERDVRVVSRQSICATRDLPIGHLLTLNDLTCKRPGGGIPPAAIESIVGKRLARRVQGNDLLQHDDLAA